MDFSSSGVLEIKDLSIVETKQGGHAAKFCHCKKLKIATGDFCGDVSFLNSGIDSIKDLRVIEGSPNFENCRNLKVATGSYEGFVDFSESGVEVIEDLHITKGNRNGKKADFRGCPKLHVNPEQFPDFMFKGKSERRKREDKIAAQLKELQAPRKKWLQKLRDLGLSGVIYAYGESCGSDSCKYFKGEIEIQASEFIELNLSHDLQIFFLQYIDAVYDGSTYCEGECGDVKWDLVNDKMSIFYCWGEEYEDYNEHESRVDV